MHPEKVGRGVINPFNCREVARRIALGVIDAETPVNRFLIRFHMSYCWVCQKYERQLGVIGGAFRTLISRRLKEEDLQALKKRLTDTLFGGK
jgi:hypothetical protein